MEFSLMSEGKGKLAARDKSGISKTDSNPMGVQQVGLPFVHFCPGEYRHNDRYEANFGTDHIGIDHILMCSVCKRGI